jgi:uncharacterized membrane protein YebE (DUF533 family)
MNPEDLLGSLLRGALTSRGKRHRHASSAFGIGSSPLGLRAIAGAAAVAWGLYEASQNKAGAGTWGGGTTPSQPPMPTSTVPSPAVPPPVPQAPAVPGVPLEIARAIRLLVSAARADGDLAPEEGQNIARLAGEGGPAAEQLVRAELESPRPLAGIVGGVHDPAQKAELYGMAFTLLRADENVNGAERIYLAQLAHLLGLDAAGAARLEAEVVATIDKENGQDA